MLRSWTYEANLDAHGAPCGQTVCDLEWLLHSLQSANVGDKERLPNPVGVHSVPEIRLRNIKYSLERFVDFE